MMPGCDGTGPLGNRYFFGRRMGMCNMINPAVVKGALGFCFGMGTGFRGGMQNASDFSVSGSGLSPKEILEEQKRLLEARLGFLNSQLETFKDEG